MIADTGSFPLRRASRSDIGQIVLFVCVVVLVFLVFFYIAYLVSVHTKSEDAMPAHASLVGKTVSGYAGDDKKEMTLFFTDGTSVTVDARKRWFSVKLTHPTTRPH